MTDALFVVGLVVIGVGLWFLAGWPALVVYGGLLLVLLASGEYRRKRMHNLRK